MINEESNINYPRSWEVVKLGDFADSEKGKKPKNQQPLQNEEFHLPYIDIEAFEKGRFKSFTDGEKCVICDDSDFLMVWDGSRSGLVGKGLKGALGSTLVRINLPMINNLYGYYYLQSKYLEINTRAKGVGIPHVDPALLWNYDFSIPPVNEQNRIVDKIETLFSEVDAGIANLTLAKRQLEQYRQSLLKHAFEGKLTAKWRADYEKTHGKPLPTADELLEQIQIMRQNYYDQQMVDWEQAVKTWEEQGKEGRKPSKPSKPYLDKLKEYHANQLFIPLGSIIEQPKYGTSKKCTYDQNQNSIGVIRIPNIDDNGLIDLTDMKFAEFDSNEAYEYKLEKDDLLIIRSNGSPSIVGRCAVVKEKDLTYIYAGYLIRLRPVKSLINSDFLNLALKSVKLRGEIESKAKSTSGVNNINAKEIQSLELPYFDLLQQTRIVEILLPKIQLIENQLNDIDIALRKADILKHSILHKAFQGKLVPQDPNDPPASELLAQIKAEREAKALAEQQAKQIRAKSKGKTKTKSAKKPKKNEQITLPL